MKKNYLFFILITANTLIGCSKSAGCDPDTFSGSGLNPCLPHAPCEDYPDESVSISWNDYNTCAALNNYFRCHRKALEEHMGDTMRLAGWLDLSEPCSANYAHRDYFLLWAVITDDESHHPEDSYGIYVESDEETDFSCFKDKKLYITGALRMFDSYTGDCCAVSPILKILTIDTLKNDK